MLGPKISSPISDWRSVAPRLAWGEPAATRLRIAGEVQIVGAADIAEGVHQHDAVKPGAILGSGLDFGLILFIDFRADQRSGFFQLLYAFFERG